MIYEDWQKYISDDVRLTELIMPGSHNAGSYGMKKTGRCQNKTIYEQLLHGIRHFCIRMDTPVFSSKIHLSHGITMGKRIESALADFRKYITEHDDFLIIDMREYYPQRLFGNFYLRFRAKDSKVNDLIKEYLEPEKYAFCDFDDVTKITMKDIRASGKKYLLWNYKKAYDYSVDCPLNTIWSRDIYGMHAHKFVQAAPRLLEKAPEDGLTLFQLQQTPNLGTDIGFVYPCKLNEKMKEHFDTMLDNIKSNPAYLKKANILAGDFMAADYSRPKKIIGLNADKGNVKEELLAEFLSSLEEE